MTKLTRVKTVEYVAGSVIIAAAPDIDKRTKGDGRVSIPLEGNHSPLLVDVNHLPSVCDCKQ